MEENSKGNLLDKWQVFNFFSRLFLENEYTFCRANLPKHAHLFCRAGF